VVEHPPADQLEGEVDVADAHPEQPAHQVVVEIRVDRPLHALGRAVEPVGRHDVGLVEPQQPQGLVGLAQLARQIGIGVEHDVARRVGEARLERPAELAVLGMVHDLDPGIVVGELVGDLARAVGRGIVDEQHLVRPDLPLVHEPAAGLVGGGDGAPDHRLLVPHGK
jgi:hypothetical protein